MDAPSEVVPPSGAEVVVTISSSSLRTQTPLATLMAITTITKTNATVLTSAGVTPNNLHSRTVKGVRATVANRTGTTRRRSDTTVGYLRHALAVLLVILIGFDLCAST